jgi:type II secretory pathway component PulC
MKDVLFNAAFKNVIPAKAGIHKLLASLDSCFRGSDELGVTRGSLKITLTLFFVGAFFIVGIVLAEPELAFGQPKRKPVFSRESRKDPFSLPSGIRLSSKEVPVQENKKVAVPVTPEIKPVETPLKLKAILISDHIRLASIDRSIVTVGDSVNGEKVLEIRPDRVILEKEGKKRTILLDQSPMKLTVEGR